MSGVTAFVHSYLPSPAPIAPEPAGIAARTICAVFLGPDGRGCTHSLLPCHAQVLLGLRKHDQNVSSQRRVEQVLAADAAAARTMTRLLTRQRSRRVVTPAQAAAVRRPETAVSAGDLADAARLLGDLGAAAALATEKVEPCKAANTGTEASSLKVNRAFGWRGACAVVLKVEMLLLLVVEPLWGMSSFPLSGFG